MELETATIDEIGEELRKRLDCFVLLWVRGHKTDSSCTVFNSDWGGTQSSVFTAMGLCDAMHDRLMQAFNDQKREEV